MDFIETDSITDTKEVSQGRTNTQVRSDSIEFVQINEKASLFDLAFRARNPVLSTDTMQINLHVDIESQKTYQPGYPIEKRGMYYLARRLSSQLSLATERTDYSQLEKCYSIWICRDDIPKEERYTVSVYEISNTKNAGNHTLVKEHYDLMTLVVIKLGDVVYNGKKEDEEYDLLRFLNAIMYPHREDFMATMSDYIDFSENEELWKEEKHVKGLGESIYNEGRADGRREAWKEAKEEAIQSVVQDYIDDELPMERILAKLQKVFGLTEEMSEQYYQKYATKA